MRSGSAPDARRPGQNPRNPQTALLFGLFRFTYQLPQPNRSAPSQGAASPPPQPPPVGTLRGNRRREGMSGAAAPALLHHHGTFPSSPSPPVNGCIPTRTACRAVEFEQSRVSFHGSAAQSAGLVVGRSWNCVPRACPAVRYAGAVKSRRPARASVAMRGRNVIYAGAAE